MYTYKVKDALYINLTNRCSNDCVFCIRKKQEAVGDSSSLWLDREPSAEEVINEIGNPTCYSEIVFCGYGEPLIRLNEVKKISKYLKDNYREVRIRINTNGHGNLYHRRNIVPELAGLIDAVSISLNAPDRESYFDICRPKLGEKSFEAVLEFASLCKRYIPEVTLTVVDFISEEQIEKCRKIAENIGVNFRVRTYS